MQKLHLSILDGESVAIVGNVGSGKLSSLMGEMNLVSGSICMKQNRVAYCEQTPWVIKATVKENILLGSTKSYSEEDFHESLSAVDAHVYKHMFHEGIVKVIAGRTRILVTHNCNCCHIAIE